MDCGACAQTLERAVGALRGADHVRVSFGTGIMEVDGEVTSEAVLAAVAGAGYRGRSAERGAVAPASAFWRRDARAVSTTASIVLLVTAVAIGFTRVPDALVAVPYLLSMGAGGWPIARAALLALRRRTLDMNVLMSLAAVGAVGIGDYAEGAWVLVLFALGTTLETFALARTRGSVESLMELAPDTARLVQDGQEQVVPVSEVSIGSQILVRPGERVPLDGKVTGGSSGVDESPITGESIPVDKETGDEAFAGSLNTTGALTVRVTRPSADSTLSRIAALVERAQGSRAPTERFVDRFARIYTPLVFGAAILLALVPPLLGGDPSTWIYRGLALLIVACPCALVISIPVSVVSAIGAAARDGVLIKSGQALEDLARVRALAIDKTGTLTLGLPRLRSVVSLDGLTEREALRLAASVEAHSEHPLAGALVRSARDQRLPLIEPGCFIALPGRGVEAQIDGRVLWAGGPRLVRERAAVIPAVLAELEARGESATALGEGDRVLAAFGLADEDRHDALEAVAAIRTAGIERVVMLTGDAEPVARAVAERVGVDEWRSGLLPADKLAAIEALENESGGVTMAGDGVNDAPALAAARVGIAMGAAGSDVALETADVALMRDELPRLAGALQLARRSARVLRQNIVASLAVKAVFVALVPFGFVTLWMAVAADMGMSLLVTLNGLRLFRSRD